jgi:hypothetical protein
MNSGATLIANKIGSGAGPAGEPEKLEHQMTAEISRTKARTSDRQQLHRR